VVPERPAATDRASSADRPIAAEQAPRLDRPFAAPARPDSEEFDQPAPGMPIDALGPARDSLVPPSIRPQRNAPLPALAGATHLNGHDAQIERGATAPQLRRFIKSRAYVPMHELRRRFAINGGDDEVTVVDVDRQRVYVGLPEREGRLLGELLRGGDIGYELSLDPISPIVVGVYPMRPVTRA
jgi:hypothetical protein